MIEFGSTRHEVAALPPDVRKGSALPTGCRFRFRGYAPSRARGTASQLFNHVNGKAKPFRTSGGIAATNHLRHRLRLEVAKLALPVLIAVLAVLFTCIAATAQEVQVPEGVNYKTAPEPVNTAAKSALQAALASDQFPAELFGEVTVCGPMLWKALQPSADIVLLSAKPVIAMITDPEAIHAEGKRLLSADERRSFWILWQKKYPGLKKATLRKARADELSFYWATIPFDIEEPLFVVDTGSERFIVHMMNKQEKTTLFWIDLVGDLRTLKNKVIPK
jgi:hypothetical protein